MLKKASKNERKHALKKKDKLGVTFYYYFLTIRYVGPFLS